MMSNASPAPKPSEPERSTEQKSRQKGDSNKRQPKLLGTFSGGIILLIFVLVAVFSLSELTSRMIARKNLQTEINQIESEIATIVIGTISKGELLSIPPPSVSIEALDDKKRQLESLERIRLRGYGLAEIELDSYPDERSSIETAFRWILLSRFQTESLLAITVMCCTAVGAMIAGFRGGEGIEYRSVFLGVASGFVVYLGVKGGRFLFLVETGTSPVLINPYGTAFVGVLVGLFSESAYEALREMFDSLTHRLRKTFATEEKGPGP